MQNASSDCPAEPMDSDHMLFILSSSGTTGKRKGIAHAHRCVDHAHVFARDILGATAADRFNSTSKLFFAYPLANSLFAGLRLGASVILDPQWPSPERLATLARRHRPTVLFSVPTLYQRLLESELSFDSIVRYVSAGEACPPALASAWERKHGRIPKNAFVAMRTDWSKRWPDDAAMQNRDAQGHAHYPGWSKDVLKLLYEDRKITASGHETTDTDPGFATDKDDYSLESYILGLNHYQIEMLADLDKVPESGALVLVAWPKPDGGTGFPARVIAILP